MNLRTALRIQKGDIVAFVGGGGKTSAMFRLAHELASARLRVVTTTTTKIGKPTDDQSRHFIVEPDRDTLLARVSDALATSRHVTVATAAYEREKYRGVPPEWVADLRALPRVHAVLVEADGARKLPFKAPRVDEPVLPAETTCLVATAGMLAIGTPFDEEHVCRAETAARLAGAASGAIIEPHHIARVLAHPEGGLKRKPHHARGVALLNQADEPSRWGMARAVAEELRLSRMFDEVLIGAVANPDPVIERLGHVTAVLMAAGEGKRFGGPIKQLAPWGGTTLIQHVVGILEQSSVDEIQIVLGAYADEIRSVLAGVGPKVRIVINARWREGMSTSLIAGLRDSRVQPDAAIFVNVDQPGIRPDLIDRLIERHRRTGAPIVAPRYQNLRGNPVLWDRALFKELMTLSGDVGGREILRQHFRDIIWVELASEEELTDTDTPDEFQRLKDLLRP